MNKIIYIIVYIKKLLNSKYKLVYILNKTYYLIFLYLLTIDKL